MDNVEHFGIIRQFHSRDHDYPAVSRLPVVITEQTAFGSRAFALGNMRHAKANIWGCVEWSGVKDRDAVPTRLNLNGKVALKACRGLRVVKYVFEGRILEGSSIDISGNPVIIEYRLSLKKVR